MSIIRVEKAECFSVISNYPVNDKLLSWKAKGILTYLLTKPNNWHIYVNHLTEQSKDGRESTLSGINELIKAGYIKRTRIHDVNGHFNGYDYTVYENPLIIKPQSENPFSVLPFTDNPQLINTDLTKNSIKKSIDLNFSKKRKDNNTSNNNINIILEKFSELFENKLKEKYIISYGKDNKIIKDLLSHSDFDTIIKKMELFFTADLWFTKDGVFTISKFKQRWNEIIKKQETNKPLKQPVNKYEKSKEVADIEAEHIKRIRGEI